MKNLKMYIAGAVVGVLCIGTGIGIGILLQQKNSEKPAEKQVAVSSENTALNEEATASDEKHTAEKSTAPEENDPNSAFWVTKEQLQKECDADSGDHDFVKYTRGEVDEAAKAQYLSDPDSYLLPYSSDWIVGISELYGFDDEMLNLARNEIFARHGYIFDKPEYTNIFNKKSWYYPEKKDVKLTDIEKQSVAVIKWYQKVIQNPDYKGARYVNEEDAKFCDGYRIKVNEPIEMDINGDRVAERILVEKKSDELVNLYINDQVEKIDGATLGDEVWIVDIDPSDKYKEIVIYDGGPSSDPKDTYYYFDGAKIQIAGCVQGQLNSFYNQENDYIEDGIIHATMRSDILDTHRYSCEYKLDDKHNFVKLPTGEYETNIPLILIKNLTVYAGKDTSSSKSQLVKGSSVTAVSTDALNWIQLKCEDGKTVWAYEKEGYFYDTFIGLIQVD